MGDVVREFAHAVLQVYVLRVFNSVVRVFSHEVLQLLCVFLREFVIRVLLLLLRVFLLLLRVFIMMFYGRCHTGVRICLTDGNCCLTGVALRELVRWPYGCLLMPYGSYYMSYGCCANSRKNQTPVRHLTVVM